MKTYFKIALVVLGLYRGTAFAQVGMTSNTQDKSAILDLRAANAGSPKQGLLIPSVSLTNTGSSAPISSTPANSLLVFNTNTGIIGTGAAGLGYYYWDAAASLWKKLVTTSDVSAASGWGLVGNGGTAPATNFIGTTDPVDLAMRTANTEKMRITSAGRVGVGTIAPKNKLSVSGGAFSQDDFADGDKLLLLGNTNAAKIAHTASWTVGNYAGANVDAAGNPVSASSGEFAWNVSNGGTWAERMRLTNAGNLGIGTTTPTNALTINAASNPLKMTGLTAGATGDKPLVVDATGVVKTGSIPTNIVPTDVGTVIAINGKLEVAQEVTVLMTNDFDFPVNSGAATTAIGNFNNEIIDNFNSYTGTATGNGFTVGNNGVYAFTMNIMLSIPSGAGTFPVIGIWCDTDGQWVARVNDQYLANLPQNVMNRYLQTYSLSTAIAMQTGKTYSFRIASIVSGTALAFSFGGTGSGPVSFCSLKRLK